MRPFRFISRGPGREALTDHEREELAYDFDIDVSGYFALVPVTKKEFEGLRYVDSARECAPRSSKRKP